MSFRIFEGNVLSLEGWRMCNADECVWVKIPGAENVSIQVRSGIPAIILPAFVARYNKLVEPVRDADTACWTLTNSVSTSNHPAGVAVDVNWVTHQFHAYGTFGDRLPMLRQVQDEFRGCIQWGGDWGGNPQDEMHHELSHPEGYLADPRDPNSFVLDVDQRLIDLANDLQAGYLGIYTPGVIPVPGSGLTAQNLSDAMGGEVSLDRYTQLLPAYRAACVQAGLAGNLNRLAMFAAQLGEESGGLQWMEEIASGSEYEGRADLGNTQPGDGVRFKGRGPIQITGRSNYSQLSQWAFGKGYVPSPTFFVDNPTQLSADQYGFLGPVWYWTVARPQINSLCDAGDIVGVTKAINGGTNGLADRTNRWNHCLSMGLAALDVQGTPDTGDDDLSAQAEQMIADIHRELTQRLPSRSPLRHLDQTAFYPDGLVDTMAGMLLNTDGSEHVQYVSLLAGYGHPPTLALLQEVASAAGDSRYPDRQDDAKLAEAILAGVTSAPAEPSTPSSGVSMQVFPPPPPQVVYLPAPVAESAPPSSNGAAPSTGEVIGKAYDALEALRLADALPIEGRAPLAALIGVLQTKNGSQL